MWEIIRIFAIPVLFTLILYHAIRDQAFGWFGKTFDRENRPFGFWVSFAVCALFLVYGVQRAFFWSLAQ